MQFIPGEELAIDRKARVRIPLVEQGARPPTERTADFEDTYLPLSEDEARKAAERCIHCPDPAPCYTACPVHNDIPSAMWLIEQGDFLGAAALYRQTSSMPEICGRVCPHEQLVPGFVRAQQERRPGADRRAGGLCHRLRTAALRRRDPARDARPARRVAMVGAGPAGMGCAELLVQQGHA